MDTCGQDDSRSPGNLFFFGSEVGHYEQGQRVPCKRPAEHASSDPILHRGSAHGGQQAI